jgi:hypothetical protein
VCAGQEKEGAQLPKNLINRLLAPQGLVRLLAENQSRPKCLAGFGVFFRGSMKTPENTSKHLWVVWWVGFGMFRPDKTR